MNLDEFTMLLILKIGPELLSEIFDKRKSYLRDLIIDSPPESAIKIYFKITAFFYDCDNYKDIDSYFRNALDSKNINPLDSFQRWYEKENPKEELIGLLKENNLYENIKPFLKGDFQ